MSESSRPAMLSRREVSRPEPFPARSTVWIQERS
jgi:hypothetical protein